MTLTPRPYPDIVRDMLTSLTQGAVRESLVAPEEGILLVPDKLKDRPVRYISHLEGVTRVGTGDAQRELRVRFTEADFELVSTSDDPEARDAIRFREDGRKPVPGSTLKVNYYPVQTQPVPITDLNVGSVARTLVETFARELALAHLQLEHVYKSAFLETAEGDALDKVVALVGASRLPPRHPVVKLRFHREPRTAGRVTVPVGTPVVDAQGARYLTLESLTLEPNESVREVLAGGESPATPVVEAGTLNRLEVLIAGIKSVDNDPARELAAPETDEQLRRRARGSLHGAVRGTLEALEFGLRSIPEVKTVSLVEEPNGVPGEIRIEVAYGEDSPAVRELVARRIDELRPAGIRVVTADAASQPLQVQVALTLAGTTLDGAELAKVESGVQKRLTDHLTGLAPGSPIRAARLSALALEDVRVVDASIVLAPQGGEPAPSLQLESGQVVEVTGVVFDDPAFEQGLGPQPATTTSVSAHLPVSLLPGVSAQSVSTSIEAALRAHLRTRGPEAPLSVDSVARAIRDDARFALERDGATLTIEAAERFVQLADGPDEYVPSGSEVLQAALVEVPTGDEPG